MSVYYPRQHFWTGSKTASCIELLQTLIVNSIPGRAWCLFFINLIAFSRPPSHSMLSSSRIATTVYSLLSPLCVRQVCCLLWVLSRSVCITSTTLVTILWKCSHFPTIYSICQCHTSLQVVFSADWFRRMLYIAVEFFLKLQNRHLWKYSLEVDSVGDNAVTSMVMNIVIQTLFFQWIASDVSIFFLSLTAKDTHLMASFLRQPG